MAKWKIRSMSKFINHALMLWVLMERHNVLSDALQKVATLEGCVSVDELIQSLSERHSTVVRIGSETEAQRLSG